MTMTFKVTATSAAVLALATPPTIANEYFERVATLPVYHNLPAGSDPASETVAEIVAANDDATMLVYTDSPGERLGMIDISDPATPQPAGGVDLGGEPTSVAIVGEIALAGVNTSESYTEPSGHVAVVELPTGRVTARCDVGGQPDSVAVSPDGAFLAVAVENERDEDLDDGVIPQLPAGHLAIFDLADDGAPANCLEARIVDLTGLAEVAPDDPEPEYVDVNAAGQAVLSLQENNHIVIVDLASGEIISHFSAGTTDVFATDILENDLVEANGVLQGLAREPDAVAWIDDQRIVTANEGDYQGGSRGFTIFNADGTIDYDSDNLLEYLAMLYGQYPEFRAENKGVEPEGVAVGEFGDDRLIFVNGERGNFVTVFVDEGAAATPRYLQFLPTGVGPEGVLALPQRDLLVVASEVDDEENGIRSTITIYQRGAALPAYPQIAAGFDLESGRPYSWGALSGLVGDPSNPDRLYAVSDSAYAVSRIYPIDAAGPTARIIGSIDVTKDGEPVAYDLEGITLAADGGFWLASEGNPENDNPLQQRSQLIKVDADGQVIEEVFLPESLYEQATRFGFEGVASFMDGEREMLAVAVQRGWLDDPENAAKIGLYDTTDDSWRFVHYPLEAPKSERGGWVGLSEITSLGDGRFLLIERDNQPGDYAVIKTVTEISLADVAAVEHGGELPILDKRVIVDVLTLMRDAQGWVSDKPEGLAVTADGNLVLVTDNDALNDASGETQFLDLGPVNTLN